MMKIVRLSIYFVTAGCMLLTVQSVTGSSSISSFVVKSLINDSWVKDAEINQREAVRLECATSDVSLASELNIKRADRFHLNIYVEDLLRQSQSLVVILRSVTCNQMGTYVCENGLDEKTVDLGIYDCPPQPCKDQRPNITLYASVNETKQFSICVEAFPYVSSLTFADKQVEFDKTNENLHGLYCTQAKSGDVFNRNHISCRIKVGGEINFGLHDLSISGGLWENEIVRFTFDIKKAVNPKCPTDIKVANQSTDSVTLSWQPGDPGAESQWYSVNYTCLSCWGWKTERTGVQAKSITISNLITNTTFIVRIDPQNSADLTTTCEYFKFNTVVPQTPTPMASVATETTQSLLSTTKDKTCAESSESDEITTFTIIIAILSVLAILAVTTTVFVFCFHCRFRRLNCQPWTRTQPTYVNGRHIPETTQDMSLIDYGDRSHLRYQNIIGEPIYQTVV